MMLMNEIVASERASDTRAHGCGSYVVVVYLFLSFNRQLHLRLGQTNTTEIDVVKPE